MRVLKGTLGLFWRVYDGSNGLSSMLSVSVVFVSVFLT